MTGQGTRLPGGHLRAIARLIFDADTLGRVVDPTLADMQHEIAAADDEPARRTARWRGYLAFWKLVLMSPFAFGDWPGRRQFARSAALVGATLLLLVVALSADRGWLTDRLLAWWPDLPERIGSIGVAPYAWLLGPIIVGVLALRARRSPFRTAPLSVLLIAGAATIATVSDGAAVMVATMSLIGRTGSGSGSGFVGSIEAVAVPALLAICVMLIVAVAVAFSQWRLGRTLSAPTAPAPVALSPLLLTGCTTVSLVVVHYWLRLNEALLETMTRLLRPTLLPAGAMRDLIGRLDIAIPLVVLGWVLAVGMIVAGMAAWRTSSANLALPLTRWTIRAAVAVVLIGGVWHGVAIGQQLQTFRQTVSQGQVR